MIKSAVFKLTLYYLALVMGLSLGFSLFLYHVSSNQLNRSLRRPTYGIMNQPGFEDFRQARIGEAEGNLMLNFVVFNVLVLLLGGFMSYALAQKTLQPIEEAMEAQSRFTADASHELRTPLTAMQTEIEVALRNAKLSSSQAKLLLKSNLEEVIKLRHLAESLLKLARQEGHAFNYQSVSLEDVAIDACGDTVKAAQAKHITIENNVKPLNVLIDKTVVNEVLSILMTNAIKYSPNKTTVTLSSHSASGQAFLTVADQGPGISPKDLPHIFDRFYRSDTSRNKTSQDGYGLGLSIAKQLLKLHGGSLSVKSTLKQGSRLIIELPLVK